MKVSHLAIYTQNLEEMRDFYIKFFKGKAGDKYINASKGFESYFIKLKYCGLTLELMRRTGVTTRPGKDVLGFAHIAFKLGSKQEVRGFTDDLRAQGVRILCEPRFTGDGFFESVIADYDGNKIELIA